MPYSYPSIPVTDIEQEYDYVIVGGGTSGCVLARRLNEIQGATVLLVERGDARDSWWTHIPLLSSDFAAGRAIAFSFQSEPVSHFDNRVVEIVGGRALGGTSRINSMLYTRGLAGEFNAWASEGRKGWGYAEMEKYFIKSESSLDCNTKPYQGTNGLWQTMMHPKLYFPASQRAALASQKLGIPVLFDVNDPGQPAVGTSRMHYTITSSGQRHSTMRAFLPKEYVRFKKGSLTVCANAFVRKIDVGTDESGILRARGIFVEHAKTSTKRSMYVSARREIILASGAISSPQLLMLSGIGPAAHLAQLGIPLLKDLPGVGSYLQDHMGLPVEYQIPANDSWLAIVKRPWRFVSEFIRYVWHGKGLFLAPIVEVATFMNSRLVDEDGNIAIASPDKLDSSNPANIPDFEMMPESICDPRFPEFDKSKGVFCFLLSILKPKSAGAVRLRNSDPWEDPSCDMGYLTDPDDWNVCRAALRLTLNTVGKMRQEGYDIVEVPGHVPVSLRDEDLDVFIRRWGKTLYHYSSTCRMAPEDDPVPGVVDDNLRVYGVHSLRVADASIFPSVPGVHPQAAIVAVAEKCADIIKAEMLESL